MHIKRLHLRIPGNDAKAGHDFVRRFTKQLANHSPDLSSTHVGAMHLKIRDNTSPTHAAQSVASRLNSSNKNHA